MKVVNIAIPSTLQTLTSDELKALAIYAIQERAGRDVFAEILSKRFDTKRKINSIVSGIHQQDISQFYCDVRAAGITMDYNRTYFLIADPYRTNLTIKQL